MNILGKKEISRDKNKETLLYDVNHCTVLLDPAKPLPPIITCWDFYTLMSDARIKQNRNFEIDLFEFFLIRFRPEKKKKSQNV